jgi:hypothetical protein
MKLFSTYTHGILDFLTAVVLLLVPRAFRFNKTLTNLMTADAFILLTYSLFTRYEWGMVRKLPMSAHLGLDAVGGLMYVGAPWLFPEARDNVKRFLAAKGVLTIAAALLTETQPGWMKGVRQRRLDQTRLMQSRRRHETRRQEIQAIPQEVGI